MIRPTSCVGKKPLGIATNSAAVSQTVARNTSRVMKRKRSATSRVRTIERQHAVEHGLDKAIEPAVLRVVAC